MLVLQADTNVGRVLLAVLCDGMGGLAKGEVASATMIRAFHSWFCEALPELLESGFEAERLRTEWTQLITSTGQKISQYARSNHVEMGTTVVAMLTIGETVYTLNVGDSRIYCLTDALYQLTKDQTYVQREMDQGRMTPEQAAVDPQKNVLLQCVGASAVVEPEFGYTQLAPGQVYLLCSDGFRHVITPQEFYQKLAPNAVKGKSEMKRACEELTRLNISRGENDNISSILIKTMA